MRGKLFEIQTPVENGKAWFQLAGDGVEFATFAGHQQSLQLTLGPRLEPGFFEVFAHSGLTNGRSEGPDTRFWGVFIPQGTDVAAVMRALERERGYSRATFSLAMCLTGLVFRRPEGHEELKEEEWNQVHSGPIKDFLLYIAPANNLTLGLQERSDQAGWWYIVHNGKAFGAFVPDWVDLDVAQSRLCVLHSKPIRLVEEIANPQVGARSTRQQMLERS